MKTKILGIPKYVEDKYLEYLNIPTPYFKANNSNNTSYLINKFKSAVYKGKGKPNEIKEEIQKNPNIGIDCSGFVSNLLEEYCIENKIGHIWNYYKRTTYNPLNFLLMKIQPIVSMLNAETLTSLENCIAIDKAKDARPLDLIKMSGGKHLVMIYKIYYEDDILKKIEYIQSTEGVGVCSGNINIIDENKDIINQDWTDYTGNQKPRFESKYLIRLRINLNGIRRPKFLVK